MSGAGTLHPDYITDEQGNKKAVVLSFEEYEELLEDLHDLAVVAERRDEEEISHDQLLKELRGGGSL